jgi:class 3 adenylate cyclase
MFVADDARDGCEIALRLVDAFHDDEFLPPVRGGPAWGETITQEGDYFGPVVNLAARATKVAQPENVLVPESITQEVSHARLT